MTKRIWAGLLALGMALTALPSGMYAEEAVWEEETDASEETFAVRPTAQSGNEQGLAHIRASWSAQVFISCQTGKQY